MRVEVPAPEYHLLIFSVSSRLLSIECLSYPSEMSSYSTFPDLATSDVVNHACSKLQRLLSGILHDNIHLSILVNLPPS
jgi:hypothetical protein